MKPRASDGSMIAIAAMALPLLAATCLGAPAIVGPAMVGGWDGNARIIVAWCQQTNLPVSLTVAADGRVQGKVGDATLTNAHLNRNRGPLGRRLNLKTDYIVVGDLHGPIVASEQITRSRVSMPLNFAGGTFAGGVHTSGTKWGGKQRMIFSASQLTLVRRNPP